MNILGSLAVAIVISPLMITDNFHVPEQYQQGATRIVHFVDTQAEIDKACGKAQRGLNTLGCAKDDGIYVTNPCKLKDAQTPETYEHLMCHELAHTNGWHHVNE